MCFMMFFIIICFMMLFMIYDVCDVLYVQIPSLDEKRVINRWAHEGEKIFHGTPSGVDNSTCVYGIYSTVN